MRFGAGTETCRSTLLLARLEENLFMQHDALELASFRDDDQANAFYRKTRLAGDGR